MKSKSLLIGIVSASLLTALSFSGCSRQTPPQAPGSSSAISAQAQIPAEKSSTMKFYKASEDGLKIVPVEMKVKAADKTARNALKEMLRADRHSKYPVFPTDLTLKSISIKDETAYANFNKSLNLIKGATAESLFIAAVVDTLTEFPNIREVQITADGQPPKFQMDMTRNFKRDESYIKLEKK